MTNETKKAEATDLSLAAIAIFDGGQSEIALPDGKKAIIKPATMRQLPTIIKFFQTVVESMDSESLGALIEVLADKQRDIIAEGGDPSKVKVEEIAGTELVRGYLTKVNLLAELFAAALSALPPAVTAFTNLSEDEFNDLSPDYGILIVGGIFTQNYAFFTQSLPPILTAFMRSQAGKRAASQPAVQSAVNTVRRRK